MDVADPRCPECGQAYSFGERECDGCGRRLECIEAPVEPAWVLPCLDPHGDPPVARFRLELEGPGELRVGGRLTREFSVDVEPVLIGRRDPFQRIFPDVDLGVLEDFGYVSREHASLHVKDGQLLVTDLKGQDATAVNEVSNIVPSRQPRPLEPGDRLILGETVTLTVHSDR